jgi:hypothetical protein
MLGVTRAEADAALGAVLRCIQEALAKRAASPDQDEVGAESA